MHLAIWDLPPASFIRSGFSATDVVIEQQPPAVCRRLLDAGQVDVALLPTVTVLSNTDVYDVLSAVALSSWDYPFARLVLKSGLDHPIETLALAAEHPQEAFLARLILKEHYGAEPQFITYEGQIDVASAPADAVLVVGSEALHLQGDDYVMDLGQEWYELVNYPMVWGLFAVRKGEATPEMIRTLRQAAQQAEQQKALWMQGHESTPELYYFFQDSLRIRMDDLAVAGITELRQYLYYYGVTDEVKDLPLVTLPEAEASDDDTDGTLHV